MNTNADFRLIRLSRKTNSTYTVECNDSQQYLSTDYFDVLHCVKKKPTDSFCSIMGIGEQEPQKANEIAIQSYALYCSEDTLNQYKGRACYGDPFEDEKGDKHFLSLIQVYITPEIIARAHLGEDCSAQSFLGEIERDIHAILERYVSDMKAAMIYRVYNLLSTGDFAVVVRSTRAETSFEISTALRRRYVCVKDSPEQTKLVLYKTYTLLTMAESVINAEIPTEHSDTSSRNQFVIRCCYSNKYWSEKQLVDAFWKSRKNNKSDSINIYSLNGRYDFTVYLTEQEFKQVFPYIAQYKHIGTGDKVFETFEENGIKDWNGVNFLIYLMKNEYVSYVNERYLLKNISSPDTTMDESILAKVENRAFVSSANEEMCSKVLEQYKKVTDSLQLMHTNRRDLMNYMDLLYKLIQLCQTINSLSDTRIYASVLLEQISVLLDSINDYIHFIDDTDGINAGCILELMSEYLKESVGALDKYSQYIRNNNLQSLQTPNYNIESNTSMEKLLIAYSEFVHTFIAYYMESKVSEKVGERQSVKKYIPIVVPDLKKATVSVEVMLPDWNVYGGVSDGRYLMVITCPTLRELGDVPSTTASLFHEIAHQFRYEKREMRNKTILSYTLEHFFETVVSGIVKEFELDKGPMDIQNNLVVIFRDCMREAFMEIWYPDSEDWDGTGQSIGYLHENREAPLAYFEDCILGDVELFLKSWNYAESILAYAKKFIGEILPHMPAGKILGDELLSKFDDLIDLILNSTDCDTWSEYIRELQWKALDFYKICGEEIFKNQKDDLIRWEERMEVLSSARALNDTVILWETFDYLGWEGGSNEDAPRCPAKMAEVSRVVRAFCQNIGNLCNDQDQFQRHSVQRLNRRFRELVYEKICDAWSEISGEYMKARDEKLLLIQSLDEAGRYYGIDYKCGSNQKIFSKRLSRSINNLGMEAMDWIRADIAAYREETADLFMCSVIPLNLTGYVNLMAQKLHIDDTVPRIHLIRIIRVAAAKWCRLDSCDFADFYESYREQCVFLLRDIVTYVNGIMDYYHIGEGWKEELILWNENPSDELADRFALQIERLIGFVRALKADDPMCKDDLLHGESMLKIILDMVQVSFQPLYKFYENQAIKSDYIRGVQTLKALNLHDASGSAETIGALCCKIEHIMNCPWEKYQDIQEDLNRRIIEFLLCMHCENKRRNARKTEEVLDGC